MGKFKTDSKHVFEGNTIDLNVYSISDNSDTLLGSITSLINNVNKESFIYKLSYTCVTYVTKDDVETLYMIQESIYSLHGRKMFISLTNDMNLLIECLFYVAINYGNIISIEYLIDYHVNNGNLENISDICTENHVEPLKHIILNDYKNKLSLKHLACRKVRYIREYEDIDKLQIPRELREYIKNANMIKEIFYSKGNIYNKYNYLHNNYLKIIKRYGLHNIVNYRLLVKGVKEFNCDIHSFCGNIKNGKKNYILYCEVTSYNEQAPVRDIKYVSITFHIYGYYTSSIASMNCELLEQLPLHYDLVPIRPIYLSITAGSFYETSNSIENEVFVFSNVGSDAYEPEGYYRIKLDMFVRPQCVTSDKRKIEDSEPSSSNKKMCRRNS